MNKNEFKKEYLEYKAKLYEIDRALEINVNEFLRVKKNENFMFLDYEDDVYGINDNQLIQATIGALQEEIHLRDKQIEELI